MKKIKSILLSLVVLVIISITSAYTKGTPVSQKNEDLLKHEGKQNQTINLFVTHGHCSTPFGGIVDDLKVSVTKRVDLGNPLEDMKISFEIDPNSFNVCSGEDLTARIKTPGLFIGENNEKITFISTEIYTMGIDWYQINGKMSIKGVEKDVKLFATGIRDSKDSMTNLLVIQGRLNLFDWGIDYDKIVNGRSDTVPTKWMYINMKVTVS